MHAKTKHKSVSYIANNDLRDVISHNFNFSIVIMIKRKFFFNINYFLRKNK